MQAVIPFILAALKNPKFWFALITFISGAVGYEANTVQVEQIASAVTMIFVTLTALVGNKKKDKDPDEKPA